MDRFAAISDVHGNLFALKAVLRDIERRRIETTVNLGDHLAGPLDPLGTADCLMPLNLPSIRGNCDRHIYEAGTVVAANSTLASNRLLLPNSHKRWLEEMPQTLRLDDGILLCHGTPWADDVYLLEEIAASGVRLRLSCDLAADVGELRATLILCGHSHVPRSATLPSGALIVNPGSVGLQAYADELPHPHVMEAGTPHTRYAILERVADDWQVEHIALPYAWEDAGELAERNERPDWAKWLRTGRA